MSISELWLWFIRSIVDETRLWHLIYWFNSRSHKLAQASQNQANHHAKWTSQPGCQKRKSQRTKNRSAGFSQWNRSNNDAIWAKHTNRDKRIADIVCNTQLPSNKQRRRRQRSEACSRLRFCRWLTWSFPCHIHANRLVSEHIPTNNDGKRSICQHLSTITRKS